MDNAVFPPYSDESEKAFTDTGLSSREKDALRSALSGMTADDAASLMGISPSTVGNYRARAYEKLGLSNRAELLARFKLSGEERINGLEINSARTVFQNAGLNTTQTEVLSRISAGCSTADIASSLALSEGTVCSARARGYQLLGVHSKEELGRWLDRVSRGNSDGGFDPEADLHVEAPASQTPRRTHSARTAFSFGIACSLAIASILAGCLYASKALSTSRDKHGVRFPLNENGMTYGTISQVAHIEAKSTEELLSYYPDLIEAEGVEGIKGYVKATDLIGSDPGHGLIPVYSLDGKTVVDHINGGLQ